MSALFLQIFVQFLLDGVQISHTFVILGIGSFARQYTAHFLSFLVIESFLRRKCGSLERRQIRKCRAVTLRVSCLYLEKRQRFRKVRKGSLRIVLGHAATVLQKSGHFFGGGDVVERFDQLFRLLESVQGGNEIDDFPLRVPGFFEQECSRVRMVGSNTAGALRMNPAREYAKL